VEVGMTALSRQVAGTMVSQKDRSAVSAGGLGVWCWEMPLLYH